MTRLSGYLLRQYFAASLAFLVVAGFLIYAIQTLRLFDLVTAKGQDILTLFGQSALITPSLAMQIFYICMAVGLARALKGLQTSKELHTIHSSGRIGALWNATFMFIGSGMIVVLAIAHWIEPAANRHYDNWSAEVTADLVGRSLNPNRFSEVVPGLILVIGGRDRDGTVLDFFADDRRNPDSQRTYIAKRAEIISGPDGYNLELTDGAIQFQRTEGQFTEINFAKYELGLDRLVENDADNGSIGQQSSLQIILEAGGIGGLSRDQSKAISQRFAEGARLGALCLFAFCLTAFPTGKRRSGRFPLEIGVVVLALIDRAIGGYLMPGSAFGNYLGASLLVVGSIVVLGLQLYGGRMPKVRWGAL